MSVVNLGFARRSEIGRGGVGMGKGKGAKLSFGQFFTENCTKMKEIGLRECTPFRSTKVCTSDFAALSQPIRRSKEGVWASVVFGTTMAKILGWRVISFGGWRPTSPVSLKSSQSYKTNTYISSQLCTQ